MCPLMDDYTLAFPNHTPGTQIEIGRKVNKERKKVARKGDFFCYSGAFSDSTMSIWPSLRLRAMLTRPVNTSDSRAAKQ